MADIFFLLAGIVLLFKKKVSISKKRTLTGFPVKILAALYILPFVIGFLGGILVSRKLISIATTSSVTTVLVIIAIVATLYFIIFYKEGLARTIEQNTPDIKTETISNPEKAKTFSTLGIVFAFLSLLVLPIIFGPTGIVFGVIGTVKGDKKRGIIAIVLSVVLATISVILGAYFINKK